MIILFVYLIPVLIIATGIYLSFWTDAIKDISTSAPKPYSFSRTQLMFWTIIIMFCISIQVGYGVSITQDNLRGDILALLGIGTGTATLANLIDRSDIANAKDRQQDRNPSQGFLYDILDDGNGISIHRFQALIFNLLFGITFIFGFLTAVDHKLPVFTNFQLGLLGISSSAYLAVKASENNKPVPNNQSADNSSEEEQSTRDIKRF